jgi:pimeloyl-ACP methyl ester carboxylesterase
LLVHATGFHARVLAPFADALGTRLHCYAVDLRGQGDSGEPADGDFNWDGFGKDVLAALDALGLQSPVGIGHSCGGAALFLAEQARPGSFSSLYCFEPVVFPAEHPPSPDPSDALAKRARQRREVFASREEAYVNYASKPPLSSFDRRALRAYVEFGFEDLADGTVRLRCRGENEARIYENGFRHQAFSKLEEVVCPTTVACGAASYDFTPAGMGLLTQRLRNGRVEVLDGLGHFGPLERPEVVAVSVIRALDPPPA